MNVIACYILSMDIHKTHIQMLKDTMGANEAALMLGVDGSTIRRWAKQRKIRHIRLPGQTLRFFEKDILDAITIVEPDSGEQPEEKTWEDQPFPELADIA